jgi:hypothetical protein
LNFPASATCFIACDTDSLSPSLATFSNKFLEWHERPQGSRLTAAIHPKAVIATDWLPLVFRS